MTNPENLQVVLNTQVDEKLVFEEVKDLGTIRNLSIGGGPCFIVFDESKRSSTISLSKKGTQMTKVGGGEFTSVLIKEPLPSGRVNQ